MSVKNMTEKCLNVTDMTLPENQRTARHYCAGLLQGASDPTWGEVSESYVEYVVDLLIGTEPCP